MNITGNSRRFHAVCAPGLEPITAAEVESLGAAEIQTTTGGVGFSGPLGLGFRANLWLRTAVEVRLRLARFHAPSERLLAERAREVDWEAYLAPGAVVDVRVSTSRSVLSHSGRIAELVEEALSPVAPGTAPMPGQRIYVRLVHDTCTLSIDMSGEPLHRRGYRQEPSRGPLRESLAAALILALGWDPSTPFIDPMCGSGTLVIEAALISLGAAPGRDRTFACEHWPVADSALWPALRAEANRAVKAAPSAPILGYDRNAGAIGVARRNAERAGVMLHLTLERHAIADLAPPDEMPSGLLLTNPPYGRRVREVRALETLYAEIGHVLARHFAGWRAALLSAEPRLDARIALPRRAEHRFMNGGLPCRLIEFDLAPGS